LEREEENGPHRERETVESEVEVAVTSKKKKREKLIAVCNTNSAPNNKEEGS
jgi:hypothetical protein